MKSKNIVFILISATLAGCGSNIKYKRMASDTTYSHDGHRIITTHVYAEPTKSRAKNSIKQRINR